MIITATINRDTVKVGLRSHKRVFIVGAGVSAWAGFPLGRDLWSFLLNHLGFDSHDLEFIAAHLAFLSPSERPRVESDLELLLTRLSEENVSGHFPIKIEGSREEKEYLRSRSGHLRAAGHYDFDSYYDIRLSRRASGIVGWSPSTIPEFIKSLAAAFSHHHSCILSGRGCYTPGVEAYSVCPCFPKRSFNQQGWRIRAAIKRAFRPGDTIITFNWDCLLESILWDAGLWSFSNGYGLPVGLDPFLLRHWDFPSLATEPSRVTVLKAHGSINWITSPESDRVGIKFLDLLFGLPVSQSYVGEGWDEDIPDWPYTEDILLAPMYQKDYSESRVLGAIWDRIIEAIGDAEEISTIGYSLPRGDLSSRALLAYALRQNKRCRDIGVVGRGQSGWAEFLRNLGRNIARVPNSFEEWCRDSVSPRHRHTSGEKRRKSRSAG